MKITKIYKKYNIMPKNLAVHMLRVGAVASLICKNFKDNEKEKVDKLSVVSAALLHDMGNIIKFDLTYFPDFLQPEGLKYWESVKKSFIEKYGNNEHEATKKIISEITSSEKINFLSNQTGFSKAVEVLAKNNLEEMICTYADMRVGPNGILSLVERCADGKERYKRNSFLSNRKVNFEEIVEALKKIENIIFDNLIVKPDDINDETVNFEIELLKNFQI